MASIQIAFEVVLLFFVLVTIHEWGHFYFAKRAGILVREFAIGFGPKLISVKKGETRYTLRLLPIGGFVRMAGEDPEVVQVQRGQKIAVSLQQNQVNRIYLDQVDQRIDTIVGEVENIDLEKDLFITLSSGETSTRYDVHPQAMMVTKGIENQIAPWNRQFASKTIGQRSVSILAGPIMNFILAFILFASVAFMLGTPTNVKVTALTDWSKISSPSKISPAKKAGLMPGDEIVSINNTPIGTDSLLLTNLIKQSAGKPMEWVVKRNNVLKTILVTPDKTDQGPLIGVGLGYLYRSATVGEGLQYGWKDMTLYTKGILSGFKKLVTLNVKLDDLGGPVRIIQFTGEQASEGKVNYIHWAALLSLYLGLFNLLPFPALDGSRLVFLFVEALRGRPVDPNRESMVHFIGFAMLMLLMLAVTYNDILRLIKG